MRKRFLMIMAIVLTTIANAEAKVELTDILADNMILLYSSETRLWVSAASGSTANVSVSDNHKR